VLFAALATVFSLSQSHCVFVIATTYSIACRIVAHGARSRQAHQQTGRIS